LEEGVRYTPLPPADDGHAPGEETSDEERALLEEATRSPKAGLILLGGEIERETRNLAASLKVSGHDKRERRGPMATSLMRNISILTDMGVLPKGIFNSLDQFRAVRNEIVHGGRPVSDDDIFRAIDSGLSILRVLKAVPRFRHVVRIPWFTVYSDPQGKNERVDVHGISLESINPGGITKTPRILARRENDLHQGDLVTFDFNPDQSWDASWYIDETSGDIELAWEFCAEFTGQKIDSSTP
jgi:Domain of unknown function (DUF4145)